MAVFTLSFKELYDMTDRRKPWEERVKDTADRLFNFTFSWYNDNADGSLDLFKKMFVENHFTDEIGFETLGLFKMKMQSVFFEKIPYYTDLYRALHIEYDPLINYNVKNNTESTGDKTDKLNGTVKNTGDDVNSLTSSGNKNTDNSNGGSDTTTSTANNSVSATDKNNYSATNDNQRLLSDFPQANFSTKKDYAKSLDRFSENNKNNSSSERSENAELENSGTTKYGATFKGIEKNTREDKNILTHGHVVDSENTNVYKTANNSKANTEGWSGGSKTDELEKYRKAIRNLNEMLLHEFDDLFMCVYEPYDGRTWISPIERGFLS